MRKLLVKVGVPAAALVVLAAPAASAHGGGDGGGWVPTSTPPFDIPAAVVCPFEVKGDIVKDDERMRTLATFPDGSPRVQDFAGRLVIRFTNVGTGRSVVRDASGSVRAYTLPDGTLIWQIHGNAAIPVRQTNVGFPPGDYIVRGDFVLIIHPDHQKELPVQLGTRENICQTIG
jgi:hypothetical protein